MKISTFDLFSIGIGPSSSHTVGPMRAANRFVNELKNTTHLQSVSNINVTLFGSLAWTGIGHGTPNAVLMGLEGELPESIDPQSISSRVDEIKSKQVINLLGQQEICFQYDDQLILDKKNILPGHSNGMRFEAFDNSNKLLLSMEYYSIGGGFILRADEIDAEEEKKEDCVSVPYPFQSADELVKISKKTNLTIAQIMFANEKVWRDEEEIKSGLLKIWSVMHESINNGCKHTGILPGRLKVKRRAPGLFEKLTEIKNQDDNIKTTDMNWLSLYAISVNEENAAGGRVVTAPTNGAAGIIPSVLQFYLDSQKSTESKEQAIIDFLLTAAAIGILYKENASISAAEVGCQGEVGVACSMAAAAFAAVSGGSIDKVENAAEIGMEHHLGLTCDPIAGLVQIPCIERNAMGSVQAVNAARLALLGDGEHKVSLDDVIQTMRETGRDMLSKYKETAQGGLAVNVPEC